MISIPPQAISVQSAVGSNHKGPNGLSYTWYVWDGLREETVTSSDMWFVRWNGFQQQQYQEKTYQRTQEEGDKPGDSIAQLMICLSISNIHSIITWLDLFS